MSTMSGAPIGVRKAGACGDAGSRAPAHKGRSVESWEKMEKKGVVGYHIDGGSFGVGMLGV